MPCVRYRSEMLVPLRRLKGLSDIGVNATVRILHPVGRFRASSEKSSMCTQLNHIGIPTSCISACENRT